MKIIVKRQYTGPSAPELGTPTAITFGSATIPLARPSSGPLGVASYTIQRATSIAGPYTTLATGPLIFGNQPTAYVDGALASTTTYFWRANAADSNGFTSEWSAPVTATTTTAVDSVPPTVPTGLSGTALSTSSIRWSWNPSTDTGGSGLAGYELQTSANGTSGWAAVTTSGTATTADETGLSASQTRFGRIRAFDGASNFSLYSVNASATTSASGSSAYAWYPALDLATIPFHTAAGAWGIQQQVVAPVAPVTTRDVNVSTFAQLAAEMLVPGSRITVTANITTGIGLIGGASSTLRDIDVIIPPGIIVGSNSQLTIDGGAQFRRVRIRGNTVGTHSGGQIKTLAIYGVGGDLIFDGISITCANATGGTGALLMDSGIDGAAIVNCRLRSNGYTFLGTPRNLVVAGTNVSSAESASNSAGWAFRMGGLTQDHFFIFYNCQIRTNLAPTYQCIRFDTNRGTANTRYGYVANCDLMNLPEGQMITTRDFSGGSAISQRAVWALNNRLYAQINCAFDYQGVATYARATGNQFFSPTTQANMNSSAASCPAGDEDFTTGNTYAAYSSLPAWGGPGDPTAVPF